MSKVKLLKTPIQFVLFDKYILPLQVAFLLAAVSVASASTWGVWPWGVHAGAHWAAPHAAPVVLPSGHLADTPEVAAAKGAHLAELARQGGATGAWAGHWAAPAVLPSGHIADTPEVLKILLCNESAEL